MLYLCVSDIHGDIDALRAVLATAENRAFSKLLVAGDLAFPGPQPLETWRRLTHAGAVVVQGLTDRALATVDADTIRPASPDERMRVERFRETQRELGDLVLERLRRLPAQVRFPLEDGGELLLVHGSPIDAAEAMTHDMSDEDLAARLGDDPADVIVCGMSHVPFDRVVQDTRIVNVGSVGEAPGGDEGRERVAHATWIDSTPSGVSVEQFVVPLAP